MDSQQARLLNLLHHETTDFVVVGGLAPRTADRNDLLSTAKYDEHEQSDLTFQNGLNRKYHHRKGVS